MTSINSDIRLASDCPNINKRISHCADLGEYMKEAINRQWLRQFGDTRYFEHSVFKQIVNLVNPNLTFLEQWQIQRG
jgi:hypothetical protein